jgi:hypothetical protein
MTPKQKSIELMNRFEHQDNLGICENTGIRGIDYEMAKQCALIAVDEIISELTKSVSPSVHGFRHNYWEEVKQEIQKL